MVWVGSHTNPDSEVYHEDSNPEDSVDHVWRPHSSVADSEFRCDYDLVVANISELNILAGDGTHQIQHTTDGARLKVRQTKYNVLASSSWLLGFLEIQICYLLMQIYFLFLTLVILLTLTVSNSNTNYLC